MSFRRGDFDMQPLSKVKPDAVTNWGDPPMEARPQLAVKVAHCIARWAENEVLLGAFLAFLLHANEQAALAMYSGLENRSAQLRLVTAAAKSTLSADHFEIISTFMTTIVRPAMKERDRLAHWHWGYCDQLPDALLIADPARNLRNLMVALKSQRWGGSGDVPTSFHDIFVVRDGDLEGIKDRGLAVKEHLRLAMSTVWELNDPQQRLAYLVELSNVPQIRESLDRQKARQSS
jgi:hypothetical protein